MFLENRGIPTVVICTEPFTNASLLHAKNLGNGSFQPVIIPHPLGGLGADQVKERAAAIQDRIVDALIDAA